MIQLSRDTSGEEEEDVVSLTAGVELEEVVVVEGSALDSSVSIFVSSTGTLVDAIYVRLCIEWEHMMHQHDYHYSQPPPASSSSS